MKRKLAWAGILGLALTSPAAAQTSGSAAIWGTQGLRCIEPAGVAEPFDVFKCH